MCLRLVNVVFAGLLAMNFYEPLAKWLTNYNETLHSYVSFLDFLALWTCFVVFMVVFRTVTDAVSRVRVRFPKIFDLWGGIVLSLCIGWVMVGFTLVSLHAAPLARYPLLGSFQPQSNMFFGMFAPDREWLGFTKYQSWGPYCRSVGSSDMRLPLRLHREATRTANASRELHSGQPRPRNPGQFQPVSRPSRPQNPTQSERRVIDVYARSFSSHVRRG